MTVTINPPQTPITGNLQLAPEWWRYFFELGQSTNEAVAGEVLTPPGSGLEGGGVVSSGISLSIAPNGVTDAMIRESLSTSVIGRAFSSNGDVADIQAVADNTVLGRFSGQLMFMPLSSVPAVVADGNYGDITVSGTGAVWTINNAVVSNAKLANVATATLKGRVAGGSGAPSDLTGTQATTLLDVFTSALKGLAPASGGGSTNFLRADGTWAAPPAGTVTSVSGTANEISVATGTTTPVISLPSALTFTGKTVTGGTYTGAISFDTTGAFTSSLAGSYAVNLTGASTNFKAMRFVNTGSNFAVAIESSTGGNFIGGSPGYSVAVTTFDANPILFGINNTEVMRLTSLGLNIIGLAQCDSFRIDQSPTAETVVCTHTITISVNGTNYKIPIVAA